MKTLIISDIHSNYEALFAVIDRENADQVICLGDLVDFGPQPAEVVQWVRHHVKDHCVMGNHDDALAHHRDCRSGPVFHDLAEATREMNRALLTHEQLTYLRELPPVVTVNIEGYRLRLAHATPAGNLYDNHLQPSVEDENLAVAMQGYDADFICCGHTHLPMVRSIGRQTFVNPGSVGLPLDGDPRASYAVFHEGKIKLRRLAYDIGKVVRKWRESALREEMVQRLASILESGRA